MDDAIQPPKKQGRPVEFRLPDKILTDFWYKNLVVQSGKLSPAAIARQIIPEFFDKTKPDWENHKSKRDLLGKISRLEKAPPDWFLAQAEVVFPGTSYWCHHPFRYLAKRAVSNQKELYAQLSKLENITSILFYPRQNRYHPVRRRYLDDNSYEDLSRESDIDALTACIGLMIEAELFGDEEQYLMPARKAEEITLRLISSKPYTSWSNQLYEYLSKHFFDASQDIKWSESTRKKNLIAEVVTQQFAVQLIDELHLRNTDTTTEQTCIYFAQSRLHENDIKKLWQYRASEQWKQIKNYAGIIDLGSAIRIYERKKHVQSILQKHNVVQITSKLVKEKQHQRSPKISPGGQLHRNTHVRGLDQIDHDAGDE